MEKRSHPAHLFLGQRLLPVGAWLGRSALDFVYPPRAVCAGCGEKSGCAGDYLCAACQAELEANRQGILLEPFHSRLCGRAHAHRYAGPAGHLVRALKYDGVRALVPLMARDMVRTLCPPDAPGEPSTPPLAFDCVVAVPMHRFRRYLRGANHAELLARAVAAELDLPLSAALVRIRTTKQQARLSGEARRKNLRGAFQADAAIAGRAVLLIDDVYTTGSTAEACAAALLDAGAAQVFLLTYAVA